MVSPSRSGMPRLGGWPTTSAGRRCAVARALVRPARSSRDPIRRLRRLPRPRLPTHLQQLLSRASTRLLDVAVLRLPQTRSTVSVGDSLRTSSVALSARPRPRLRQPATTRPPAGAIHAYPVRFDALKRFRKTNVPAERMDSGRASDLDVHRQNTGWVIALTGIGSLKAPSTRWGCRRR